MKKYEFTGETKRLNGAILHRIRAVRDFGNVKAGDLGGWIEGKRNLSHDGNAWVFNDALVCDKAKVFGNAKICDEAKVFGEAKVYGDAVVSSKAKAYGNARVCDKTWINGEAKVCGNAEVHGKAWVYDKAEVFENAEACGDVSIYGNAKVYGEARVYDEAKICGNARLNGGADVSSTKHVLVVGMIGSRNDFATFYRTKKGIGVGCGCFLGGIEDFLEKVEETHGNSKHAQVYRAAAELAKIQIGVD